MKRTILSSPSFCAVTEDGTLVEYILKDPGDQCGDILLGKIDRMMPGIGCAFVDIGRKKDGYLPLTENSASYTGLPLRSGEIRILQVKKEESGEKGAFLTCDITLPGRYVILMPLNRHIGVSSRIDEKERRENLKELGLRIAAGRYGLVLRKASENGNEEEIREEAERLFSCWQDLCAVPADRKPGDVLMRGDLLKQMLDDYLPRGVDEVREVETLDADMRSQLARASARKVQLRNGGNVVIDRCEAMTVIDVNTASFRGDGDKRQSILETNLEACRTVSEQIRLRNLSGIILIDFIDMDEETDRSLVLKTLESHFLRDRIRTVIHGWTSLGLLEMTRRRTRPDFTGTSCRK